MRLLDRYLLRELFLPLTYCLTGFLIFWISFDLIASLDEYQRNLLLPLDVAEYYLVRLPELLVFILPVVLLLALLYALTTHARHHEIVAMRAAGLSLWRIGAPYLSVGLVLSLFLFYLNEHWVPDAATLGENIMNRRLNPGTDPSQLNLRRSLNFKNDWANRIWTIGTYDPVKAQMSNAIIEWSLADGVQRRIIAERGEYTPEGWTFYNVRQFDFPPGGLPEQSSNITQLVQADFTETPELIRSEIKVSSLRSIQAAKKAQLSIAEIRNYLRLHRNLPASEEAKLNTQLHGRLAEPWTCLVVVLIAIPFGAASGRRNVFVGVANSIFICFSYFILLKLGLALGTGGYLPSWIAAYLPNGFFTGLGLWMIQRVR